MSSVRSMFIGVTSCIIVTHILCVASQPQPQVLTSTEKFVISNGTATIAFIVQDATRDTYVSISKKQPCQDIEEQIFIGQYLTPGAREGITVYRPLAESGHPYEVHFDNAQDSDIGTYIVNVLRRTDNTRYNLITSRYLSLVNSDSEDIVCDDDTEYCSSANTGWVAAFSVVFVILLFVVCINIVMCIKLWPAISAIFKPEGNGDEDIYVLRNVGSTPDEDGADETHDQDDYEAMDETITRKSSVGKDVADDALSESSVPPDDAPSLPPKESAVVTSDYDMPDITLGADEQTTAGDPELDVSADIRSSHSNIEPSHPAASIRLSTVIENAEETVDDVKTDPLPSRSKPPVPAKTRPKSVALTRASNAPIVPDKTRPKSVVAATVSDASETDVVVDPYERINVGQYS